MKSILSKAFLVVAGIAAGAGGALAIRPSPPEAVRGRVVPPPAAPTVRFFGFVAESAEESSPAAARSPLARYVPARDRCVAGFDATSTLHDFRGFTKDVAGEIRFDPERLEETAAAEIAVDVRTLDTGNAERDQEMRDEHLEVANHPQMKFKLGRFRRIEPAGSCVLGGTIEIHGTSREIELPGTFELRPDGWLHVKGEFTARMSDFGIAPPVTAFVIRVGDEIRIWFELWARPERSGS